MSEEIYDALVVGGAVSGSRTAQLLAKEEKKVLLVEDNLTIGHPCKCTGLVSWRILELLPHLPKSIIMNSLKKAKFFSPNGSSLEMDASYPVYLLNRPGLDKFIFDSAVNEGAETRIGERFVSYRKMNGMLKVMTNNGVFHTKLLIGADGANSTVGREAGLKYPSTCQVGVQTTVEGDFENAVELWFGSKLSPNFFAWLAPEGNGKARIGLATNPHPGKYYQDFLTKRIGKVCRPDVGGIIRPGLMEKTSADSVMVVGDAACQIKPYSGGGINYSLIGAQFCTDAAVKALDNNNFSESFLRKNYDNEWKKELGPGIKRGMFLYKLLTSRDSVLNGLFAVGKLTTRFFKNLDMDLIKVFV